MDISEVEIQELRVELKQKSQKAPEQDRIIFEMLNTNKENLEKAYTT